nr:3-phosphoshikimate 1-carboxyvinyltransferase [Armatimonadota bacterium]NIO97243.1 3-phosphoshikimate 1-carboxyvinyltransferase [Armatimonadota bacterium]
HRALMLGALAEGETHINGLLDAEDVSRTAECLAEMGVSVRHSASEVIVEGRGEAGLVAATRVMDAGNSGTTLRLLMGIAAGYPFQADFTGDASLRKRPFRCARWALK